VTDPRVDDDPILHRRKKRTRSPEPSQGLAQGVQEQATE
jgi:hypothetical protein